MVAKWFMGVAIALAFGSDAAIAESKPAKSRTIELDVDKPLPALIEGQAAQLEVVSGFVDRLTLNPEFVAKHGIKPATLMGNADVNFWGKREIKGKNRPISYEIGGAKEKGRAFWFFDVPQSNMDGRIGPFAIPYDIVVIRLSAPTPDEKTHSLFYFGDVSNGSNGGHVDPTFRTTVNFAVEKRSPYPLASAATGAAIAAAYGGTLSGDVWEEEIAFGVKRPVRLLSLKTPFKIGQFSFSEIAVRARSGGDGGGAGDAIAEAASQNSEDPAEIVVLGTGKKARQPIFTFDIGRNFLDSCSTIAFDKVAKQIRLSCRSR